jgi:hypothetical protein
MTVPPRASRTVASPALTAEAPLANVVDPNSTFVTKLRKDLLPAQDLYGGTHRRLRQLGRDYLAGRG